jgi:hypothetical protein
MIFFENCLQKWQAAQKEPLSLGPRWMEPIEAPKLTEDTHTDRLALVAVRNWRVTGGE